MELLRLVHGYILPPLLPVPLITTPLTLITLVLFVWSLAPALKGEVRPGFVVWVRVTWLAFLLPAVTGVALALGGLKVPSSTDVGGGLTKYGLPVDPKRDGEHWMYAAFALLSLFIIEVLIAGRLLDRKKGLRYLPVVTLFLYGVAYMVARVAVFPGNSVATGT